MNPSGFSPVSDSFAYSFAREGARKSRSMSSFGDRRMNGEIPLQRRSEKKGIDAGALKIPSTNSPEPWKRRKFLHQESFVERRKESFETREGGKWSSCSWECLARSHPKGQQKLVGEGGGHPMEGNRWREEGSAQIGI